VYGVLNSTLLGQTYSRSCAHLRRNCFTNYSTGYSYCW